MIKVRVNVTFMANNTQHQNRRTSHLTTAAARIVDRKKLGVPPAVLADESASNISLALLNSVRQRTHTFIQTIALLELRPAFLDVRVHFVIRVRHTVIETGVLVFLPQFVLASRRRQSLLVVYLGVALVASDDDDDDDEGDRYDDEPYQHGQAQIRTDEVVTPGAVF